MAVTMRVSEHIKEVQSVIEGSQTSRDDVIATSWTRCIDDYHLDPVVMQEAYIVPHTQLKEHRERLDKLIRTAKYGLDALYHQVADHGYVLMLTDAEGVTVDYQGDASLTWELKKAGLYLGAEWSEARAGTCGVGSCIYTGEALTVHQSDHFDATHSSLSCTAAPIYDVDGSLAAVLDISALQSPEPKASQALTLQLVTSCTRRIEMASLMNTFRRDWIIRLSQSPAFLDVDPECAMAVDAEGRIIGMTHSTQRLLSRIKGNNWRQPHALLGCLLSDFFNLDINELPALSRALPTEERLLATIHGDLWFAHAIAPQPSSIQRRKKVVSGSLVSLYGDDAKMADLAIKATTLSMSDLPLLLNGETGTGKEFLAKAIHESSSRKSGPFIAINCAAIPESLIESELFGYADGAFTGARSKGKRGLIEQANNGTLFLDEIGDMPLSLQARLLRVLAERELLPVGATKAIPVSFRVLAATHKALPDLVSNGSFREDLFYRINGATLTIPALRERSDILWLVGQILTGLTDKPVHVSTLAGDLLEKYPWPGNIRELENTLRFALAFCVEGEIQPEHLPEEIKTGLGRPQCVSSVTQELLATLEAYNWNISETARALGVDRSTIHRRMKKERIERHYQPQGKR
ncbi:sigma-54-dependent Fis family transcriptional regulator [Grimontia marina]|uniref:Acetoin catabolism regulatory protein n=1 Tax=Grimontia marina TaxID=646534 RepID=A0A128F978_9GAMM|nr:sigma-54-dependent Fis family transcriptional regulator [Grimontia marina]CZF83332.1 Acetoin catabolism regulatory protein [Grimontia marina]